MHDAVRVGLCALFASAPAFAVPQSEDARSPQRAFLPSAELLRVPIQPEEGSDAAGVPRFRAARATYKVELGRGFALYPLLGAAAPRALPLAWRTASLRVGSNELPLAADPTQVHEAERYELRHGGWSERYDLRDEGLELSWQFDSLPRDGGDLVIEGAIATPLAAVPQPFEHGALLFADGAGDPILRFGAATAFDARGASCAVETAWDGERVRLRLSGAWLRDAAHPILVDPLVGPTSFTVQSFSGGLTSTAVALHRETSSKNLLVAFTRAYSATDYDVYAALCDLDFGNPVRIYADTSTANSDRDVCAAYVGGADRWIFAYQRDFDSAGGQYAHVRIVLHDRDSLVENSGTHRVIGSLAPESYTRPDLGGSVSSGNGTRALLVCQRDSTTTRENTDYSEIVAVPIDAANAVVLPSYLPGVQPSGTPSDREEPAVSPVAGPANDGWAIAWSEYTHGLLFEDWDIVGARTDGFGLFYARAALADGGNQKHCTRPRIAGEGDEFLVSFGASIDLLYTFVSEIRTRRVDWSSSAPQPTFPHPVRTVAGPVGVLDELLNEEIAFCTRTRSHWVVSYRQAALTGIFSYRGISFAARVGGSGAPIESHTLFTDPVESGAAPAVAYDPSSSDFFLVCGSASAAAPLQGFRFGFPVTALASGYGTMCGSGVIAGELPYAGNYHFDVRLHFAPPQAPAVLLLSLTSAQIPLDALGMIGCALNLDAGPGLLASIARTANASGNASVVLPLPDAPVFAGDCYAQWVYLNAGANALGAQSTRGLEVRVR